MISSRIAVICSLVGTLSMQALGSAGTDGANFLNIPVGAGPAALGSAYTALATDAYAPIYNPAGLGFLSGPQLSAQHLSYLEAMHYEFGSFVMPLGGGDHPKQSLGVSVQYLGSGEMDELDPSGARLGGFSSHYAASSLAYGRQINDRVSLGLTGKWIHAKLADVSANAYAADIGALYKVRDNLNVAATLKNLGTKLKFQNEADTLPRAVQLGAAYRICNGLKVTAEALYRKSGNAAGHFGTEWQPLSALSLRTGYKTDTTRSLSPLAGFTAGVGVRVWGQELAYAWLPYGDLGDTQYVSLLGRFGNVDQARNLVKFNTIQTHRLAQEKGASNASEPEFQQLLELFTTTDSKTVAGVPSHQVREK